jgi:hypothetical protein
MIEKRKRKRKRNRKKKTKNNNNKMNTIGYMKKVHYFKHYSIWHIYNQSLTTNTNNILNIWCDIAIKGNLELHCDDDLLWL